VASIPCLPGSGKPEFYADSPRMINWKPVRKTHRFNDFHHGAHTITGAVQASKKGRRMKR
jgi:hypothetical protein